MAQRRGGAGRTLDEPIDHDVDATFVVAEQRIPGHQAAAIGTGRGGHVGFVAGRAG